MTFCGFSLGRISSAVTSIAVLFPNMSCLFFLAFRSTQGVRPSSSSSICEGMMHKLTNKYYKTTNITTVLMSLYASNIPRVHASVSDPSRNFVCASYTEHKLNIPTSRTVSNCSGITKINKMTTFK